MERNIEKDLIEIECAIKEHKKRDNTFTTSVLERCHELVSELKRYRDLQEQERLIVQVYEIDTIKKCEKCGYEESVIKETWITPALMKDDDFDNFFWTKEQAEEALKKMEV